MRGSAKGGGVQQGVIVAQSPFDELLSTIPALSREQLTAIAVRVTQQLRDRK